MDTPSRAVLSLPCRPSVSNYDALAGLGSDTFRTLIRGRSWRAALLGTAAAGALWAMAPRPAIAACLTAGATATCTGNEQDGISSNTDFDPTVIDTLVVHSLDRDIAPAPNVDGIEFERLSAGETLTIKSNTQPFQIQTSGDGAGIRAIADGRVTIEHVGNIIASNAYGIDIESVSGDVNLRTNALINSYADGIIVQAYTDASITHTGDITSTAGNGISVYAGGAVHVEHVGNIVAGATGIAAGSMASSVTIKSQGSITADCCGIFAAGMGAVTVEHTGDVTVTGGPGMQIASIADTATVITQGAINAGAEGLWVFGIAGVSIAHTGDISAQGGGGIYAVAPTGPVSVTSSGRISADDEGIYAGGLGDVTVNHIGDITAGGTGVYAYSQTASVAVTSRGNIVAQCCGIRAEAYQSVTINHTGDVTVDGGEGIVANAVTGAVSVTGNGRIKAYGHGISAYGAQAASIAHTGDITAGDGGILVFSSGGVSVNVAGSIDSVNAGIDARSFNGGVAVTIAGNVVSADAMGIDARAYGGAVTVISNGTITSSNAGIAAQGETGVSITHTGAIVSNNGSGIVAFSNTGSVNIVSNGTITGNAAGIGATSNAGSVNVISNSNITANTIGIIAIGVTGANISHSGDITAPRAIEVLSNAGIANAAIGGGTITGSGPGGIGVYAGSDAGTAVTVRNATVAGNGAGIAVFGGGTNTVSILSGATVTGNDAGIDLRGAINTLTIDPGGLVTGNTLAIRGGNGDDTIINNGIVIGNVGLGGGTNLFDNQSGGLFNSGATVNLGAGTLRNDGILSPGGVGTLQTTRITGNMVQGPGGRFAVDLELSGSRGNDRVDVTGTANLSGLVVPTVLNLGPTTATYTILSAAGGTTKSGLAVQDTAVVDYTLLFPNPNDVNLQVTINFAPGGLTPNQGAVGQHLQNAFLAGGGDLGDLLLSFLNLDSASYSAALDRLSPGPLLAPTQPVLWSSIDATNALHSCPLPVNGQVLLNESSCLWLRASGRSIDGSSRGGFIGFDERAAGFSGGLQTQIRPNWFLGAALGYEDSRIDIDNRARARGDVFNAGLAIKYIDHNWLIAGSINGTIAHYDTSRFGVPGGGTAVGEADVGVLDARLRIAYAFGAGALQVKPMVDIDLIGVWRDAITETGAGPASLRLRGATDWLASVAPAVEIGGTFANGATLWRPFLRAGVRFLSEDTFSVTALFAGSPAGAAPFTVTAPFDSVLAEVSTGLDIWQNDRFSLRIGYDGRFGEHITQHGGQLKLRHAL